MNRCKICGAINEDEKMVCKSCHEPLSLDVHEKEPKRFMEILFGLIFVIYGITNTIVNLIVLDRILLEPIMFIFIGVYMIGSSVLFSDYKEKVDSLEQSQLEMQKRIEFLEQALKK